MRNAGAEVIMPWSVNAGFLSRIINTRGEMGWDVPIVGQTTLGSGQTKALLEKPEYWDKVYSEQLPAAAASTAPASCRRARPSFVDRLRASQDRDGRHAAVVDRHRLRRAAA